GATSGIGASGSDPDNLRLLSDGLLSYTGATQITDRGFTLLSGSGYIQVTNSATTLTFTGAVVGPGNLIKRGAGTLVLSGNNTLTGQTTVQGGRLVAGSQSAFDNNGVLSMSDVAGAVFDLGGNAVSFTAIKDGTPVAGLFGGNIDLDGGTLTIADGGNATYT